MSKIKRNELSNLLRRLADYVDHRSDAELLPLIQQAASLKPERTNRKKYQSSPKTSKETGYFSQIGSQLQELESREAGEALLLEKDLKRDDLETLARILQLPVQRDDSMERLRAKIVENVIGSRLRSDAIQGGGRSSK
jgi:hypothetical protein